MRFNIHTHIMSVQYQEIFNHRIGVDKEKNDNSGFFSAGIHPWDIEKLNKNLAINELKNKLIQDNCLALGECGFDKLCGTNLDYQREVFRAQLDLAQQYQKKVLIIHCVKAYQEIIDEKKRCTYDFIWILHAFNGSKQLIKQLSHHGFYFSLGTSLFKLNAKITHSAKYIPLNQLFLETDDSEYHIDQVYTKAASLLNIPVSILNEQIENNIKMVFNNKSFSMP